MTICFIFFLGYRLLLSGLRTPGQPNGREPQQDRRIVVGGNPVLTLDTATVAAMDHHLLPVRPKGNSYGCHQRATGARSIPRPA
ncbi:MAG: hypothetical protein K0S99_1757 [Thermomicrobiales bacterium]|nr:hypothetical protein [Thermomicrobiales bacterium]